LKSLDVVYSTICKGLPGITAKVSCAYSDKRWKPLDHSDVPGGAIR
jgi:hypothetical protein